MITILSCVPLGDGKELVDSSSSNSETESSDAWEDHETDSETDGEGEDCTDLYPPELLKQEIEIEVESEENVEPILTQNGEHRSSANGHGNPRKRKRHIQRKNIKHQASDIARK